MTFKEPNTILGIIPLGSKTEKVPINQIASVRSNFRLKIGKLILGLLFAYFALSSYGAWIINHSLGSSIGSGIWGLLALNFLIDAFEIDLDVFMTSGRSKAIDFLIIDKHVAKNAEIVLNRLIENRLTHTDIDAAIHSQNN